MKKTAFFIMIITLLSKLFGFARDMSLSYFFGASSVTDAYVIALNVPNIIFGFISVGIFTAFIPLQSRIREKFGEKEANLYTSNFINIILAFITIIFILSILFTTKLVKIFAIGFEGETLSLAVNFTRITLISMYFSGIITILSGYMQVRDRYILVTFSTIPVNIVCIISIILSSKFNYYILVIGNVLSVFVQLLILLPSVLSDGYRHRFVFDIKDKYIKESLLIAIPAILGISVNQINATVDKTLATSIAVGSVTSLNYASRINIAINGLLIVPLITVLYPTIAKYASRNDHKNIKKYFEEFIISVFVTLIPMTIITFIFSEDIVRLLFSRGKFDQNALDMTSSALKYYSIGLMFMATRDLLSRVFYSFKDSKTPMINASIGMVINIILNIILSKYMGIGGLALATSIAAIITTILLFRSINKKIDLIKFNDVSKDFVKIIISSVIMISFDKINLNFFVNLSLSSNISFVITMFLGIIIYIISAYSLKVDFVVDIVKNIKKKTFSIYF